MRMRRVATYDLLPGARDIPLPSGIYSGIMIRLHGTSAEGETAILDDFGTILHRFRGQARQSWRCAEAWVYTHLRGGRPEADAPAGGDFAFSFILPLRYGLLNSHNPDDNVVNFRNDEAWLLMQGVDNSLYDAAFADVLMLEDVGYARYIPQIVSQRIEWTGADRVRVSVPNIRHILMQQPQKEGLTALPESILFTRDNRVRFEGNWAELLSLTDIDSQVELGAAATGYIMPDLGSKGNPAVNAGGRYELQVIGAEADSYSHLVQFGYDPIEPAEYREVEAVQTEQIREGIASSPQPPTSEVAPVVPAPPQITVSVQTPVSASTIAVLPRTVRSSAVSQTENLV